MCYQFPLRLQNAGAGGRGLLPALGAVGCRGHRTGLLLGAAPRPLPPPRNWHRCPKHPGPSAGQPRPGWTRKGRGVLQGAAAPLPWLHPWPKPPQPPQCAQGTQGTSPAWLSSQVLAVQAGFGRQAGVWPRQQGSAGLGQGNGVFHCPRGPGNGKPDHHRAEVFSSEIS